MARRKHKKLTNEQAEAPRATAGMAPNATRRPKTAPSPLRTVCTHMIMDRVYGLACSVCRRVPAYGWVYQCRQDHQLGLEDPLPDIFEKPFVPVGCDDDIDAKARVAEFLEMSPSIINGIRAGNYTLREINKLLTQRETVLRVIEQQQIRSEKKNKKMRVESRIASVGTTTHSHGHASVSKPRRDSLVVEYTDAESNCNYAVCGGCRSYFDTRLHMTFETVIDQPPLTAADMQKLRMIDPAVARTIGLRPTPQSYTKGGDIPDSMYIMEAASDSSLDWFADAIAESDANDALIFPCPGPLHCRVWTLRSGCPYEHGGFDDGNRAANHMHDFLNSLTPENSHSQLSNYADLTSSTLGASSTTASTVSLPTTPVAPLVPLVPSDESFDVALQKQVQKKKGQNRSMSTPGGKRRKTEIGLYTNESDDGMMSDVDGEVQDGVALTH